MLREGMARNPRSRKEIELENRMLWRIRASEGIYSVICSLLKYGFLAWVAWNTRYAIEALAGKETISNLSLSLITDIKLDRWVAYIVGGGGVAFGVAQLRLRRTTVERLHDRTAELEQRIDPRRSSSTLTRRGETRKEDR